MWSRQLLLMIFAIFVSVQPVHAERRVPLAIGNGAYKDSSPHNPIKDAQAMVSAQREPDAFARDFYIPTSAKPWRIDVPKRDDFVFDAHNERQLALRNLKEAMSGIDPRNVAQALEMARRTGINPVLAITDPQLFRLELQKVQEFEALVQAPAIQGRPYKTEDSPAVSRPFDTLAPEERLQAILSIFVAEHRLRLMQTANEGAPDAHGEAERLQAALPVMQASRELSDRKSQEALQDHFSLPVKTSDVGDSHSMIGALIAAVDDYWQGLSLTGGLGLIGQVLMLILVLKLLVLPPWSTQANSDVAGRINRGQIILPASATTNSTMASIQRFVTSIFPEPNIRTLNYALLIGVLLSLAHTIVAVRIEYSFTVSAELLTVIAVYMGTFLAIVLLGSIAGVILGVCSKVRETFWSRYGYGLIMFNVVMIYVRLSNHLGWMKS